MKAEAAGIMVAITAVEGGADGLMEGIMGVGGEVGAVEDLAEDSAVGADQEAVLVDSAAEGRVAAGSEESGDTGYME